MPTRRHTYSCTAIVYIHDAVDCTDIGVVCVFSLLTWQHNSDHNNPPRAAAKRIGHVRVCVAFSAYTSAKRMRYCTIRCALALAASQVNNYDTVYTDTREHTHTHARTHARRRARRHPPTHQHTYTHTHTHTHAHASTHTHTHTHTHWSTPICAIAQDIVRVLIPCTLAHRTILRNVSLLK